MRFGKEKAKASNGSWRFEMFEIGRKVKLVKPLLTPYFNHGKIFVTGRKDNLYKIGKSARGTGIWVTSDFLKPN